jgi:hypothetical protein
MQDHARKVDIQQHGDGPVCDIVGTEKGADLGRVGAVMLCEVVEGEAGVGEREGGRVGDAKVMQDHARKVDIQQHGDGPVCDIVGTGGDGHNSPVR